jgi:hypothetical protein
MPEEFVSVPRLLVQQLSLALIKAHGAIGQRVRATATCRGSGRTSFPNSRAN